MTVDGLVATGLRTQLDADHVAMHRPGGSVHPCVVQPIRDAVSLHAPPPAFVKPAARKMASR